ncbi:RNA polymerase sigma-70 factor, sigma-E family [Sinosporangium album]|uniref:RNA polymerase sigma-70 factor, sigma-E family n=1 Tax=Sinosporangium album TaxID=504805 RepID=A0A1G7RAY3_9ACTN|nr:SigE family RNA polymerase sigma factor [Sinosporangium album]SDG07912.1 RNA polymerase sigma-70 factor, sigma-E family [Sinosporangium album]
MTDFSTALPTTAAYESADFAELFAAHYRGMVRLAGLLGADDPEDIAQEAFARLHIRLSRLRDDGAALGYLRSIVCNLTRNRLRHLVTVRRRAPELPEPPEPAPSGEQAAVIAESHRELLDALKRLSRRQREALVLRYWLDLSESEIAETMGVTPGSVKTHTSRGMQALGVAMKERS